MKAMALLVGVVALALTSAAGAAEPPPRQAKVLVVVRTREATSHSVIPSVDPGGHFSGSQVIPAGYKSAIHDFDRDPALIAAITLAFRDRAPFVEIAATADRNRYMTGVSLHKPTEAARAEGFDFVLALYDDFTGYDAREYDGIVNQDLTPLYAVSYSLHDLSSHRVVQGGRVYSFGYKQVRFDGSPDDLALFQQTWPYLCLMNATDIVDELVRTDAVHEMAGRVDRGAEYPAVRAQIEAYRGRLIWHLQAARGWTEHRKTPFMHVMFPTDGLGLFVQMHVEAELLLPALGTAGKTDEEFIRFLDRTRAKLMPDSPVTAFDDISAPGYSAWKYVEPSGKTDLVFLRRTNPVIMQMMTLTFDGRFDALYPPLRGKIEQMLANSTVTLN